MLKGIAMGEIFPNKHEKCNENKVCTTTLGYIRCPIAERIGSSDRGYGQKCA
jgi:hypothetical protein